MKIGLWLQDHQNDSKERFNEVMDIVKNSDVDLIVLPEAAYTPFDNLLDEGGIVFEETDHKWFKEVDKLAEKIGKPIIVSGCQLVCLEGESADKAKDFYFAYYTNPKAEDDETINRVYFKNTMTGLSPLEFGNGKYVDFFNECRPFELIELKGQKIGMTICYDCNHSIFSAMYGVQGVDILINMTGGNVDYHKWYRYNQVRAMENKCFSFVTMSYADNNKDNSYIYGFDSTGAHMTFSNLMEPSTEALNLMDSVYVFDTENYEQIDLIEPSEPSENKNQDLMVEAGNVSKLLEKSKKLNDYLYVLEKGEDNVVFVICDGDDIMVPELVALTLYSNVIKDIKNKKYIIVNRREELSEDILKYQLDSLLRVRAMENYCAVILESPIANRCYQTTSTRQSQEVKTVDGKFGIDLKRTSGPEAIWQNKNGMKAIWREGYETLVYICNEWASQNFPEE